MRRHFPGPTVFGTRIPTPCTRDMQSTFMTVAARSGKESSLDWSCMRTLSPTCKPFQSNGVTAVSFCPSAHRGERVSSPRSAVRHGGHSHHVACAAASRLASPGKANRHRPQRRDGGGRSTSACCQRASGQQVLVRRRAVVPTSARLIARTVPSRRQHRRRRRATRPTCVVFAVAVPWFGHRSCRSCPHTWSTSMLCNGGQEFAVRIRCD